jgi:PAS domain S-box-containing protein
VGADACTVFGPATRYAHLPIADEVLRTGTPRTVVRYTPEADRWFRTQVVCLAPDVCANIAVDITAERRFAEDSTTRIASERDTLYRTLFDAVPVGVLLVGGDARIHAFNDRAHQQLGYTRDELAGLRIPDIDAIDSADIVQHHVQRVADEGIDSFTTKHRTKQGELHDVRVTLRRVHLGGIDQVLAVHEDITDEVRLTEELQQAQKLESVGRLAGGVAHDFNNLLTIILSCADALAEELASSRPDLDDDVEQIRQAGRRATDLTRQLLAFARKQVTQPVPVDLSELVRGSEKMLRRLLGEDIEVRTRLAPRPQAARCDPGLVEQVVLNLAVNARDAMPRGGTLALETADEELVVGLEPGMKPGRYVRVTIEDDGEGMTDRVKAHLFEPFFTTKPAGRGTGLGLATVYGIVKQSQGHVLVLSAPGRGTRFDVYFPAIEDRPSASDVGPARAAEGRETVLLVEDEATVRDATQRMLAARGYRVLAAASLHEALERSRSWPGAIDLVVTDVIMPAGSGRDVADAIRAERPGTRVLFVSGYTADVLAGYEIGDGELDFLAKPFTGAQLAARVRRLLDDPGDRAG